MEVKKKKVVPLFAKLPRVPKSAGKLPPPPEGGVKRYARMIRSGSAESLAAQYAARLSDA